MQKIFLSYFLFCNCFYYIFPQTCLEGKSHKAKPTFENELVKAVCDFLVLKVFFIFFILQCAYWKNLTCCTANTTELLHMENTNWNGFDYNHCGKMSDKCLQRFRQELCMYECDPYLEKWIVDVNAIKFFFKFFMFILIQRILQKKFAMNVFIIFHYVAATVILGLMIVKKIIRALKIGIKNFNGRMASFVFSLFINY